MTAITSRRAILAGACAAVTTPSIAGSAATPDPIYSAIERYLASYKFFGECLDQKAAIDEKLGRIADEMAAPRMRGRDAFEKNYPEHKLTQSRDELLSHFRFEELQKLKDTPEGRLAVEIEQRGSDANSQAAWAFARTIPETTAGAIAMIAFLRERDEMEADELGTSQNDDGEWLWAVAMASIEAFIKSRLS